mmetsp:Transcript_20477/g.57103  ORF Transcript_20477/g.57103 Transcript_20477/m.57103 type:complete len:290 (+) Transcript_20477:835-1704(+)
MRSYSAEAAANEYSNLETSLRNSSKRRACFWSTAPPRTLALEASISRMLLLRESMSACRVVAVRSCSSRVVRPLMAGGMFASCSCSTPSSQAALLTALCTILDTRTDDVPACLHPLLSVWDCLTVPVKWARWRPSTSSALLILNSASPRSPYTAPQRSMRWTNFSAAREACINASRLTSNFSRALRSSASPSGSPPTPACCWCMAWLASLMARKMSLLRLVGCVACTGSITDRSHPNSCLDSFAVPSTIPAEGMGRRAVQAGLASKSPSAFRNSWNSSLFTAASCMARR